MKASFFVPPIVQTISKKLHKKNAQAIIVGGSVRDYYLNLPSKDYDIEVYGLPKLEELEELLALFGSVNLVGKSFGVLKFQYEGEEYDFSFPRTESKSGVGHKEFDVVVDGSLDYHVAFKRRDFTINAMGYHVEKNEFIDPFNGLEDLKSKRVKYVDKTTFVEDPLRVYRAVQFCARFDFSLEDKTAVLCKRMVQIEEFSSLAKERIYEEFKKLLLKSPKPSIGFELMKELNILQYFPELQALEEVVWVHTLRSVDAMVAFLGDNKKDNLVLMFAILCHNFGKDMGDESTSLKPTKTFLSKLTNEQELVKRVLPLVEYHIKPSQLFHTQSKDEDIRQLATKVNIEELITVAKADFLGRTTKESQVGTYHVGEWLLQKAQKLQVQNKPLDNLLQGKDLIKLGFKPSPLFKKILDDVYELQLDGKLRDYNEALNYVKNNFV